MTWQIAALALDTGIPMSTLMHEPDDFLEAMFAVMEWRNDRKDD